MSDLYSTLPHQRRGNPAQRWALTMDFRLTTEQLDLQQATHDFCATAYPPGDIGALERAPVDGGAWARLAQLDVFRLAVPAARGGLGLGIVDVAVVFEALGQYLVPGPLVWTALAAIHLPELGDAALVGGLDQPVTPAVVEYGNALDALVLLTDDGVEVLARDQFVPVAVTPIDPLTPTASVSELPQGRRVGDRSTAWEMLHIGRLLTAALLVGIADRALNRAVDYAKAREQFGRPIGSFQAIKHLLADMYVRMSLARSAMYGAAAIADDRDCGDLATAVAMAKLLAADAAIRNAKACIQTHGGMGFTWEMLPHYLLKRAWVLEQSFGSRSGHAESIASELAREVAG